MNPGLLGLGTAFAWGTADFMARFSGRAVGPDKVLLVVVSTSVLMLAPLAYWQGMDALLNPTVILLCSFAGVTTVIAMGLLFVVLARGPLSIVAPVLASYPVPLVLYALWGWNFTPTPFMWAAIAVTIAGVWIVARAGHRTPQKEGHAMGAIGLTVMLSLTAVASFDATMILIREATQHAGELTVIWATRVVAFVIIAGVFIVQKRPAAIERKWWGMLLVQAVLDTSGVVFLFWGQTGEGTAIATVVSSAYGVITVVLARTYLKEVISPLQLVGMLGVFGGAATLTALS